MSVASWSGSLLAWEQELAGLKVRVGRALGRRELRETAAAFIDVLSGIERKTGWLMAEQSGADRPYRMQSLLGRSHWDADRLRDEVRGYVIEALGDADGVLIVDETGFVKKGDRSAGVARQYSGTAGRIENCQVGVFVAYASRFGQALIDRRLYLPTSWTDDRTRCATASVPEDVAFATKPKMALAMVEEALEAGVPCAYVLGDAVYGADSSLRRMLERRLQPYVLAVRGTHVMRRGGAQWYEKTSPEELAGEVKAKAGPAWRRARAPRGRGSTIGPASAVPGPPMKVLSTGCWCAGVGRNLKRKPTISSSRRRAPRSRNKRRRRGCAGPSRSASNGPRPTLALTPAKPALGMAGTAT